MSKLIVLLGIIILPILLLYLALIIYSIVDMSKRGVKSLDYLSWVLIILFLPLVGAILYITLGKKQGI